MYIDVNMVYSFCLKFMQISFLVCYLIWKESWPIEHITGGKQTGNVGYQLGPPPTVDRGVFSKKKNRGV